MKKLLVFVMSLFCLVGIQAQVFVPKTVQGRPIPQQHSLRVQAFPQTIKSSDSFTMDDIDFWVGEGENRSALVIQWNYDNEEHAMVWGYRWSGTATGSQMLTDIAKADPRLYILIQGGTAYGTAIGGIGYDCNEDGHIALKAGDVVQQPIEPGIFNVSGSYSFDSYSAVDADDYWRSGWYGGYWSYWLKEGSGNFGYSGVGATSRVLKNGSWDGWMFAVGMSPSAFKPFEAAQAAGPNYTKGTLFLNEDWFGHDNSTLNFLNDKNEWTYRAYRKENSGKQLGVTSQFATIYGNNLYIMSKQSSNTGGRLIVADAKSLAFKYSFATLPGGGDGRAFVGVTCDKGYVATSAGIVTYDIKNHTLGQVIAGTDGGSLYSGQTGMMIKGGKYVFAVKQGKGVLVIDATTDAVLKTFSGDYSTLARTADGNVWAAAGTTLTRISPSTLDTASVKIPAYAKVYDTWGAWNAGSFIGSNKENVLFWASGDAWSPTTLYRYVPGDASSLDAPFFSMPDGGQTYHPIFYGAGVRLDPHTDQLIITATESGWSNHYQNNWVYFVDSHSGELLRTVQPDKYYWFPAMPVVADKAPVIAGVTSSLTFSLNGEAQTIDLSGCMTDADNLQQDISDSVSVENPDLVEAVLRGNTLTVIPKKNQSGDTNVLLMAESNGKITTHKINVTILRPLEGIQLDRKAITLKAGSTDTLRVNFLPDNATNKNVTWSYSSYSVASVRNGVVTANAAGTGMIIAKSEEGSFTDTCTVTVINEPLTGISLRDTVINVFAGSTDTLKVNFLPADASNKQLTWTVGNQNIASFSSYSLVLTGKKAGETTLTAKSKDGGFTARCRVVVTFNPATSMTLSADTLYLNAPGQKLLKPVFLPANASNVGMVWKSADEKVATVSATGYVKAIGAGQTWVYGTSTDNSALRDSCLVVASWIPVDSIVLDVHAVKVAQKKNLYLYYHLYPSGVSDKTLFWTSSVDTVATATSNNIKALLPGQTMIYVKTQDGGKMDSCLVTVVDTIHVEKVKLAYHDVTLKVGKSLFLNRTITPSNATLTNYIYVSQYDSVAKVDKYGNVKALRPGLTRVVITMKDGGASDTCLITVVPDAQSLKIDLSRLSLLVGDSLQAAAMILPSDASQAVTWTISDKAVATVTADGMVKALKAGKVELVATSQDVTTIADTVRLTVSDQLAQSILMTPGDTAIDLSKKLPFFQIRAEVLPDNTTNRHLRWTSSDYTLATVTSYGLVKALKAGNVTITAYSQDGGAKAVCKLRITNYPDLISSSDQDSKGLYIYGGELIADGYEGWTVSVITADGKVISTVQIAGHHATYPASLTPGIYVIRATNGTNVVTSKMKVK